jgi:hypothetical protein
VRLKNYKADLLMRLADPEYAAEYLLGASVDATGFIALMSFPFLFNSPLLRKWPGRLTEERRHLARSLLKASTTWRFVPGLRLATSRVQDYLGKAPLPAD